MAFCTKCGANIADDAKFCPVCGAENIAAANAQNTQYNQNAQYNQNTQYTQNQQPNTAQQTFEKINNTPDYTSTFDPQDIQQNKVFAVLAYFGLLVLIPIFAAPKSKFARFHANQGLVLFIAEIALTLVNTIISAVIRLIFFNSYSYAMWKIGNIISTILSIVFGLAGILLFVFAIIGIINAASGKAKELPLVGKIKILK